MVVFGPVHEVHAGRYRAVVRNGVPMIERDDTAGAVTAIAENVRLRQALRDAMAFVDRRSARDYDLWEELL